MLDAAIGALSTEMADLLADPEYLALAYVTQAEILGLRLSQGNTVLAVRGAPGMRMHVLGACILRFGSDG